MNFRFRLLLFVLVLLTVTGCAASKKHAAARAESARRMQAARRPAGTIILINADERFVLIDTGPHSSPVSRTVLTSRTGGVSSAELRVSEIRKRPFIIADIVSGEPQKGDEVFQEAVGAPKPVPAAPPTAR